MRRTGVGVGPGAAACVEHELHVPDKERGQCGVNVRCAGQKFQLLVGDFDYVGQRKKFQHGAAQRLAVGPEREPQVRVKADDGPGLPCGGNGGLVGLAHGAFDQRYAAKMQSKCCVKQGGVHLFRRVEQVRRRLAVEAESAVAVGFQRDKGQRGVGFVGEGNVRRIDAAGRQLVGNFMAEGVIAQLGQQRGSTAQLGERAADIGGRTAYPGRKGGYLGKSAAAFGRYHVDQRFADRVQSITSHSGPPYRFSG